MVFLHLSALSLGVVGEYVISSGSSSPTHTLPNPVKGSSEEILSAGDLILDLKMEGKGLEACDSSTGERNVTSAQRC